MEGTRVSDIMTQDPITIKPSASLLDCAKKMVQKRVGSLLIVENKKLIGFVSQRDILWAITKKSKTDLSKIKAVDISPRKIATVKSNADQFTSVVNCMAMAGISKIPNTIPRISLT